MIGKFFRDREAGRKPEVEHVPDEGDPTPLVTAADAANRERDWPLAETLYRRALDLMPENAALWVQYGHSLKEQDKFSEAEAAYRTSLDRRPDVADTHFQLGLLLKRRDRATEALDHFRRAAEIDPDFGPAKAEVDKAAVAEAEAAAARQFEQIRDALAPHVDREFYLESNPDVREANKDPLEHYCLIGWREHRDPTRWFSTAFYLQTYEDVRSTGINPFYHYINFGRHEQREHAPVHAQTIDLLGSLKTERRPEPEPAPQGVGTRHRLAEALARSQQRLSSGLVLSVSHSCYVEVIAGTELVIGVEQKRFNAAGRGYVHLSPYHRSHHIFDTAPGDTFVRVVVDGEHVGVHDLETVSSLVWGDARPVAARSFVVHSPLGHSLPGLIALHQGFGSVDNHFWIHDYSSLCTGYNLLRNHVDYCGAPPVQSLACRVCVFGEERMRRVDQMKALFTAIDFEVVAPSRAALDIWRSGFDGPAVRGMHVVPHCVLTDEDGEAAVPGELPAPAGLEKPGAPPIAGPADQRLRVAFLGYPVHHKGWDLFDRIANENYFSEDLAFFHFVSRSHPIKASHHVTRIDTEVRAGEPDGTAKALAAAEIDVVVIPSQWPETFSFVTLEALAAGCFVLCLEDGGNIPSIVTESGGGKVFESPEDLRRFVSSGELHAHLRTHNALRKPRRALDFTGTTAALILGAPVDA